MDQLQMPQTLQEVESLVIQLYEPSFLSSISHTQEVLHRLQKSSEGWQMADGLLARPNDHVKFFGALTIIIKLNTEVIDDEAARELLQKLITWLIALLANGSGPIVVRKLCSALVTHFVHYSQLWPCCIHHLLYCLSVGRGEAYDDARNTLSIDQIIQELPPEKAVAAIWFTASLAEEAEKTDNRSTKYIPLHDRLLKNSGRVVLLLANSLSGSTGVLQTKTESIHCFQAWIMYGQKMSSNHLMEDLRPLIQPTIQCLVNEELYGPAIELLTDALGNWQAFFTPADYTLLYSLVISEWAHGRYQNLLQGDFDFDSVQFGHFLLAFGDSQLSKLMEPKDLAAKSFLVALTGLCAAEGHPVAEDKIFLPALEFWSQFVEDMLTNMSTEGEEVVDWNAPPLSHIMQVVSHCWRKIQYPSATVFYSWDSTERVGFSDARKDVADLLQSVYIMSGRSLITLFVDLTMEALGKSSWAELEASAFCLAALSDCVTDNTTCDDVLTKVFGSTLFDLLRQSHTAVPIRARQTCLSLIERYSDYFLRNAQFLPAALNLLFSAVEDSPLAGPSSRSIYRLCSSCRTLLTGEVAAFLGQYETLRSSPNLDSMVEEKIVGAIASIIQAVTDDTLRLQAFERLLMLVGADIDKSFELKSFEGFIDPNTLVVQHTYDSGQRPSGPLASAEVAVQVAIRSLRCLLSIAKGLQSPIESPVNLSEGAHDSPIPTNLQQAHEKLMTILVRMKENFIQSNEALDVICSILRAGFSETEPGPFAFPPSVVTDFLTGPWQNRVASAVSTANVFASSLYNAGNPAYTTENLQRLLPWSVGLLHQLQDPENDPELAQYGIEFASKTMNRRPDIFMQLQPTTLLEFLFMFSIQTLNGSEPLPKNAAADFWTNFITLSSADTNTQAAIHAAMKHLGPMLAHSLMQNFGGRASRSELDRLAEPLKKLVVQHAHAQRWLGAALEDASFPSEKVGPDDKALFLKKVLSLRGTRATNQVVREFWLACRGSDFAYAS